MAQKINLKWKIQEHKALNREFNILNMEKKHSIIIDFFNKKYRAEMYKLWEDLPRQILYAKGIYISDKIPGRFFREIFLDEIYNFKGFIPEKDSVVIDIGAFYGDSAIWWSKNFKAKVYAFEPLIDVYNILIENIKLNSLENLVFPYNFALGNGSDINGEKIGYMLVSINNNVNKIKTKRLDDFNFERVDFIKIDVEGFEYEVLQGSKNTIENFKPKIILEVHSKILKRKCIEFLETLGYKITIIGRQAKSNQNMDLVQNLFFDLR